MSEYYFIFIWMAAMAYLSMSIQVKESVVVLGRREMRWNIIMAIIAFIPIIHLASTGNLQGDTGVYITNYKAAEASWTSVIGHIKTHDSGFGYRVFQDTVKILTGGSVEAFRVILALCHAMPVILLFRKYSAEYMFNVFLFAASGCHIAWMMNGLRQFLAVGIVISGTGLIVRKKLVPAIALILLAATVHTSALVMLPVVFIVQGKAWNRKTLLYIFVAVIAMFVFSRRIDLMDTLLTGTEYEGSVGNFIELGDNGAHPMRVFVNSLPAILAFSARRQISERKDAFLNICVNMSIISVGIYLIAMVTSGILIGRLPIYVSLYSDLLLSYLIFSVDWGDYNIMLRGGSIVGYFLYYLVQYRGMV